jgi:hypothetical protein
MRIELKDFYNEGFGWICKHCEKELKSNDENNLKRFSRLMSEGEAENKNPILSNKALAKWADETRKILTCPRCGISESISKSIDNQSQ